MRAFAFFAVAAAISLSAAARPARAGGTSLVYTYSGRFDLRIPAEAGATRGWMADAVIKVPDHLIICDLDVSVNIQHTAAVDLQLSLRNPANKWVLLSAGDVLEGYYEGADYSATTFDDEADLRIQDAKPPFTGRHRPIDPLAAFDGADACGLWRLRVYDAFYYDTGYLDFFSLAITVFSPEAVATAPVPTAGGLALLGLVLLRPRRKSLARIPGATRGSDLSPGRRLFRGPSAPAFS